MRPVENSNGKSRLVFLIVLLFLLVAGISSSIFLMQHKKAVALAEIEFINTPIVKIRDFSATSHVSILPLVNWHSDNKNLKTEMGVSYLIKTDSQTLLFDLGHNAKQESPSPLMHNMQALNIHLKEISSIFISHNHFDHVGGKSWSEKNTFSFDEKVIPLKNKVVFAPMDMSYPNLQVINSSRAQKLLPAIATTGTIPRQLTMGKIDEQALVINIKDKGLLVVVGCGHQTLDKLIKRVTETFEQPIYGIVGDLHYPVPTGRLNILGINAQRFFASGDGPFATLSKQDILEDIKRLKRLNLGLLAVGTHDSSDAVIDLLEDEFNGIFQNVKVGQWIQVPSPSPSPSSNPNSDEE